VEAFSTHRDASATISFLTDSFPKSTIQLTVYLFNDILTILDLKDLVLALSLYLLAPKLCILYSLLFRFELFAKQTR